MAKRRFRITFPDGALTAAAQRVTGDNTEKYRRLNQPWQLETFAHYRTLGECWYPAQFYAHALPNVRLYAGIRDAQGEVKELPEDDWASDQVNRIQDPGGGTSQWKSQYGKLNFLAGDGYLLGSMENDEEGWEFVSASELRVQPGSKTTPPKYARIKAPGLTPEDLDSISDDDFDPVGQKVVAYRIWNRDPEYSMLADSPVRAVLPLYRQLSLLEAAVTARAKSRIANSGILIVADELTFGSVEGKNDDDPNEDAFAKNLHKAIVTPIKQPDSAGAVAPVVLRAPADMIREKSVMELIKIHDPLETYPEQQIREEIRERIAVGLDMPPEILKGLATANHWSAWQIDDQAYNVHIKPVLIRLCDDLTTSFLRPLAKQESKMADYEGGELVVWFDPADLINHPDRATDAKDAFGLGLLKGDALLEVLGFDPDTQRMMGTELAWWERVNGKGAAGEPGLDAGEDAQLQAMDAQQIAQMNGDVESKENAPDEEDAQARAQRAKEEPAQERALRLVGAADLAVTRSRELAGSRIVTAARKPDGCIECAERVASLPNAIVASALGVDMVEQQLGLNATSLTAGGAATLGVWCTDMGLDPILVQRVTKLVEDHAAATLYDPAPLPDKTVAYLRKAAGGSR